MQIGVRDWLHSRPADCARPSVPTIITHGDPSLRLNLNPLCYGYPVFMFPYCWVSFGGHLGHCSYALPSTNRSYTRWEPGASTRGNLEAHDVCRRKPVEDEHGEGYSGSSI